MARCANGKFGCSRHAGSARHPPRAAGGVAARAPERLPPKSAKLIGARSSAVAFSVASIWEVAIKSSMGRPDFTVDPTELRRWLLGEGFAEVDILPAHVMRVARLPWHHRDPFDRLLVAQAEIEGMVLWTADAALKPYGAMVGWRTDLQARIRTIRAERSTHRTEPKGIAKKPSQHPRLG